MKKIISILLAGSMIFGSTQWVGAEEARQIISSTEGTEMVISKDLSNQKVELSKYSYKTDNNARKSGEYEMGWIPDEMVLDDTDTFISSIVSRDIIGYDNRIKVNNTEVFPYSAICYIESKFPNGETSVGTAWMIDDNIAVTAGHCIYYSEDGGWAESVKVWPGKNGFGAWNNPYGTAEAEHLYTSTSWTNSADTNNDWGVLVLNKDIGDKTGWFGIGWSSGSLKDSMVTISGYPRESRYYQYKMTGNITACTTTKLIYNIDTKGGQSGSPIYENDYVAYGIHTGATYNNQVLVGNSGTRITEWLFNYMKSFKE